MNTYKKLMGNSIIFAIGNLGSKLITFLLLPLYTHYLTTNEYGLVDMVTTTTSLLLPILSANIFEAVLRFALDKEEDKQKVLSNSLFVAIIGVVLTLLTTFVLNYFIVNKKILIYIIVILILQIYRNIFSQFARAINKVKLFAVDGIIMTFVTAVANIILLTFFHLGIDGYLISLVIANLISILFLMLVMRVWKFIDFSKIDRGYAKEMLLYSVPMIPNSVMWWLISAANRYFIIFFIGPSANGIFAAANKIPSIVNIFSTIFGQAWQMSAIEEGNNEEKGKFYSNVFSFYSSGLFIVTAGIIMISKLFMKYLLAPAYYTGWQVIPFILLGVVFSSFAGFLAANYLASKETKGIFKTSIYGGLMSIILNALLIPFFGILGAGISNMISFFFLFVIRYFDTKKIITMSINVKEMTVNILFIFLQTLILFINLTIWIEFLILMVIFIIQVIYNRKVLNMFLAVLKNR